MAPWAVQVEGVSKKFGKSVNSALKYGLIDAGRRVAGLRKDSGRLRSGEFWALRDVSFELAPGEALGIMGVNGSGKTTLLRMMGGLDEPDSGGILKPAALTVGYLPQDGLTHAGRTVFEEASTAFELLLAPWDCKFRFTKPAPAGRSKRSLLWRASGPTPCSLAMTPFSPAGASNWFTSRRAMGFPRHMGCVTLLKSAG